MEILDLNNEEDTKTTDEMEPKKPEEKTSPVKEILSWVLTIAFAIVAAILIKNYVIINANIPSGSMENTIQIGDDIFGFRLAYTFSDPKRGDIVIFNAPDSPSEKYIKRVIGLPGETVTIEDGPNFSGIFCYLNSIVIALYNFKLSGIIKSHHRNLCPIRWYVF